MGGLCKGLAICDIYMELILVNPDYLSLLFLLLLLALFIKIDFYSLYFNLINLLNKYL